MTLYEKDFYKWTENQACILKEHDFEHMDLENLIEEILDLGNSHKSALENQLTRIIAHMLKTKYQPNKFSNSWRNSIRDGRRIVNIILRNSPSLKQLTNDYIEDCYSSSVDWASDETEIPKKAFPKECPWSCKEILDLPIEEIMKDFMKH